MTKPKAQFYINVLNTKEVSLEDVEDINLECDQDHMPFLISRIVFFRDVTGSEINMDVFIKGSQQGFYFSLLLSPVVSHTGHEL